MLTSIFYLTVYVPLASTFPFNPLTDMDPRVGSPGLEPPLICKNSLKLHIEIEEFEKPLSVQIDREFQY
jgi:hypothetical protein